MAGAALIPYFAKTSEKYVIISFSCIVAASTIFDRSSSDVISDLFREREPFFRFGCEILVLMGNFLKLIPG
jgi:hypothetical protein